MASRTGGGDTRAAQGGIDHWLGHSCPAWLGRWALDQSVEIKNIMSLVDSGLLLLSPTANISYATSRGRWYPSSCPPVSIEVSRLPRMSA